MPEIYYYKSPLGWLELVADQDQLLELNFGKNQDLADTQPHGYLPQVVDQLDEYFAGQRKKFELNLRPVGTEFQRSVWQELQAIPYGQTASYKEVASRLGQPRAMRAVGNANGRNPIAIIVPCHRVLAHDGSLGGYSSGLDIKRWLLQHEGVEF
jgi:methylated-DNA-[protein]-cysteine S-methyltransferase